MASMAVYLRSHPRSFLRASAPVYSSSSRSHFSSSPPPDPKDENAHPMENNQSNSTSSWNKELRSPLQERDPQLSQQPPRQGFSFSQGGRPLHNKPTSHMDISQIRKSLSEFSLRKGGPSPPSGVQDPQGQPSFQELYKKMSQNSAHSGGSADKDAPPRFALESIRQKLQSKTPASGYSKRESPSALSLSGWRDTLNLKPNENSNAAGSQVIGRMSEGLPETVFGKELRERSKKVEEDNALVKEYSQNELGKKLRQLRPDGVKQGDDWFSLSELNERLIKLKELDQQVMEETSKSPGFDRLRSSLQQVTNEHYGRNLNTLGVGLLGQLGGTPAYMSAPPKENLVEKYFHPDNMSSAEKLKLELKAVRDEFKMSETDCGSTRVQIAQLTTEITHLSKVLHKKDKHSKKGLLAKVQLRKKLLKYLRRTDWDSYCFILSKLGLRDNPGYKHL